MEVKVMLGATWLYVMQSHTYDVQPRYILFGGLLFQPLSRDFLQASQIEDLRIRFYYDFFVSDELYREHPEVIILSAILPDPINTYLAEFKNGILKEINGKKIKTLKDAAEAFAEPAEEYVINLEGEGRPIVLERSAIEAARERIKSRYNVLNEQNLSENTK